MQLWKHTIYVQLFDDQILNLFPGSAGSNSSNDWEYKAGILFENSWDAKSWCRHML